MKIHTKLALLLLLLSGFVVLTAAIFSLSSIEKYYYARMMEEMQMQASVFESIIRRYPMHDTSSYEYLQRLAATANHRLTLIAENGRVLLESEVPWSELHRLENHRTRPEVVAAMATGFGMARGYGTATRHSATLNIDMLYFAKRVDPLPVFNDTAHPAVIVRIGLPLSVVNGPLAELRRGIIIASILLFLVITGLSILIARRIANPVRLMKASAERIRAGDLDVRIPVTTRDEIGILGETLNSMIDQLNADILKLRKLERMRSEFLGNVSHELRTPIFAIQGMLETLLSGALDDPQVSRDFIERALRNTKRLNTLLGDLIEISRIETGDMKMSFRYFNLDEFLNSVVAEFHDQADHAGISLLYTPQAATREVLGDRERLRQAMTNLVDNALKYTPSGGMVRIGVEWNDGSCTVRVDDSGIGIAPEHLSRIFERFYRVDRERSREAGGTGLGLAIVKHIIEAHGGTISVESTPGAGSSFRFTLNS